MKSAVKTWAMIFGIVLLLTIAGIVVKVVFFPAHVADTAIDTAYGVVDQTLNANNALVNYEAFKDLYNGAKQQAANIKSAEQQIENLKATYGDPKTWTKDIREEHAFLQQNLEGYKMQYQSIVKQYNSDSSKLNRNLFKDKNLPAELPLDFKELQ